MEQKGLFKGFARLLSKFKREELGFRTLQSMMGPIKENLHMKWLIPALLILPLSSFADTTTYEVSGMTCNSCVKAIKAQVCKIDGLEKCEVSVGKLVLSTKNGITVSEQTVKDAVERAGDYKVSGSTTKK